MTQLNFPKGQAGGATYEANGVTYTYDSSVNSWTGATGGGGALPGIDGFPIDVPGVIIGAKAGDYKSTDCLLISVTEVGGYTNEVTLQSDQDLYLKWNDTCLEGPHNSTISGTLTHSIDGTVQAESTASYVLKRIPSNTEIDSLIEQNTDTDVSETFSPEGFGFIGETTWVYGTTNSTDVKLSISSGVTIPLPLDESGAIEVLKDNTIQVTQKTSSTVDTPVATILAFTDKKGNTENRYTFTTKTSDAVASIAQPQIESPKDGSVDLVPEIVLESTDYDDGVNGVHASSTWEIYSGSHPLTSTYTISNVSVSSSEFQIFGTGAGSPLRVFGLGYTTLTGSKTICATSVIATSTEIQGAFFANTGWKSYISNDNGVSWTESSQTIGIIPSFGGSVYYENLITPVYGAGIWFTSMRSRPMDGSSDGRWFICTSTNGLNWTVQENTTNNADVTGFTSMNFVGNNTWLAVHSKGTNKDGIWKATGNSIADDGDWTLIKPFSIRPSHMSSDQEGNVIVCANSGYAGNVSVSTDYGNTWTDSSFSGLGSGHEVMCKWFPTLKQYGLITRGNGSGNNWTQALYTSSDGTTWNQKQNWNAGSVGANGLSGFGESGGQIKIVLTRTTAGPIEANSYDGGDTLSSFAPINAAGGMVSGPYGNTAIQTTLDPSNPGWFLNNTSGGLAVRDGTSLYFSNSATTVLTISGTQTDGFQVGDVIDNCSSSEDGTISIISNSSVTLIGEVTGFSKGDNICMSSSSYALVNQSLADTTNLTEYTIPDGVIVEGNTYNSRVKYSNGTIESEFSPYNEFTTADTFPPINWIPADSSSYGQWTAVTYGNNRFVSLSISGNNSGMYSSDGITWTDMDPSNNVDWRSVKWNGSQFVAIASAGVLPLASYSPDGVNWTKSNTQNMPNSAWVDVTWGAGLPTPRWVAVARSGTDRTMWSNNGISWASSAGNNFDDTLQWRGVAYGTTSTSDGTNPIGTPMVVAVAGTGTTQTAYSLNGANDWLPGATNPNGEWYSLAYGNGKWVAVNQSQSGDNRVMYSTDGINWTAVTLAPYANWYDVTYGGGWFAAISNNNASSEGSTAIMVSQDGINWTDATAPYANKWYSITYGDGMLLAVGDGQTGSSPDNLVMYTYT